MKIANLMLGSEVYTSNAYLLTGTWNAIPDVNTLIDTAAGTQKLSKPSILTLRVWESGDLTR